MATTNYKTILLLVNTTIDGAARSAGDMVKTSETIANSYLYANPPQAKEVASVYNGSVKILSDGYVVSSANPIPATITGIRDDGDMGKVRLDDENRLQVNSQSYTYAISEGSIEGHSALLKFGTRTSLAANTQSVVWEGTAALYTYLTTAQQLKVVSSSSQDSAAGTGIRTLTLVGLDANFLEISETITMNGITQVTTTKSFIRIFRAYGATCGTALANVGLISVFDNAGTLQLLTITVGDAQTLMTIWTVPAGKIAYLLQINISTDSNKGARFSLFTRLNDGGVLYPWQIKYRAYIFSGQNTFPFVIPFKIPAKTDIEVRMLTPSAAGTTSAGATFELWYEDVD